MEFPPHPLKHLGYEAKQCRRWTWTMWDEPYDDSTIFSYIMYQAEICPTTGTLHFQGYCETHLKKTRKAVMKALWGPVKGKHFWCTPSKGTAAENLAYCSKSETRQTDSEVYQRGSPIELLERPIKRSRGEELARETFRLGRIPTVTEDSAWAITQYGRRLQDMLKIKAMDHAPPLEDIRDIRCILHIGPKGTGKSTAMWDGHTRADTYAIIPANGKLWWDGYTHQRACVIDEFKGEIPARLLNRILDKFPFSIEIKGSRADAYWTEVQIASNYPIKEWYSCPIEQETVARRFHKCLLYSKVGVPPVPADPLTGIATPQAK